MRLIAIGDNVTDCYLDEGIYFPGGNAVNVAVGAKRDGAEAVNYIGVFGNDERADQIRSDMAEEGVTCERSRKVYAPTCQPGVKLGPDGDRFFVGGLRDTCQHLFAMRIVPEDIEVIKNYDLCHTSRYSNLENELETISKVCRISMDFSQEYEDSYMKKVCPFCTYAFFSASEKSMEEIEDLLKTANSYGVSIAVATRGSLGSVLYDGKNFYTQGIVPVEAVDAMGAGDRFIAAFLVHYEDHHDIQAALAFAAERAASNCMSRGGWGHPHKA